jgi:hypothetical protein
VSLVAGLVRVTVYAGAVFASAPLVAVSIQWLLTQFAVDVSPLHELVADALKLCALVLLWPLLRCSGLGGPGAWGWATRAQGWRPLRAGLGIGLVSIGLTVALVLGFGVREFELNISIGDIGIALAVAALTGLAVAVIEETWFRGALHSVLAPRHEIAGIGFIALVYALVHFVRPDLPVDDNGGIGAAYLALSGMFERTVDPANLDGLCALLGAGLVLGWLRSQFESIAVAIGCHAAWVFGIQFTRRLTDVTPVGREAWWVAHYDGVIGLGFVLVLAIVMALYAQREQRVAGNRRDGVQ